MQETDQVQEEEQPDSAGNAAELMKWFGRDWTANASLRVVSRAPSGTEKFEDVSHLSPMLCTPTAAAVLKESSILKCCCLAQVCVSWVVGMQSQTSRCQGLFWMVCTSWHLTVLYPAGAGGAARGA